MVQCLLFYLLLNSGGAFLLLFLLDGEIHAQKWIDAFGRLGFLVDEANAGFRRSVQQIMQYFREVVSDCYEVVERNDLRVQAIDSHDNFSYVIGRDLIVIQLLVALLEEAAPKGNPVSVPTSHVDVLMRVLSCLDPLVGDDALALSARVEPANEVILAIYSFPVFI